MPVAPTPSCDPDRECAKRIDKAEENLRKEMDRHGEHSRQVEEKRHELEEVRRGCGVEHHEHCGRDANLHQDDRSPLLVFRRHLATRLRQRVGGKQEHSESDSSLSF